MESKKSIFQTNLLESEEKKATNSSSLFPREEYERVISRLNELEQSNPTKTKEDHRLLQKYEILEVTIEGTTVQKLQKKGTQLRFVCAEDVFDVFLAIHRTIGYGGRTNIYKATKEKYANISCNQITRFLQYCEKCQLKKSSVQKGVVVKPIVSNSMNSRAQLPLTTLHNSQMDCAMFSGRKTRASILELAGHLFISAVNIPEEIMEGMETEKQLAEALCLVNEENQNVEQGRSAESCAINCNSRVVAGLRGGGGGGGGS
ncbi:KRAB-A domain-containing protein 2-like [Palaemon carinicauda]|uniref:KRAB-A domain-containing protein 2-like n=1 Tax=Palaemon carinicauda TaxID=392227 RepID=UPI0035B5D1CF